MEEELSNEKYNELLIKLSNVAQDILNPNQLGYLINSLSFIFLVKYNVTEEQFFKTFEETTRNLLEKYKKENSVEGE